jgi:hypothetical protein
VAETDFYREIRADPYAHMIARVYLDAWAAGYEHALRVVDEQIRLTRTGAYVAGVVMDTLRPDRRDVEDAAQAHLVSERERSTRELLVALAAFGPLARPAVVCTCPGGWARNKACPVHGDHACRFESREVDPDGASGVYCTTHNCFHGAPW